MLGKLSIKSDNIIILLFITDAEFKYLDLKLIVTKRIHFQHSTHLKRVGMRILSIIDIQLVFLNNNEEDN